MKIGIDLGGSHIGVGIVDNNGKIVEKREQDITKKENMEQVVLDYVATEIERIIKTTDIEEIGIATPGNANGIVIENIVNLGIKQLDLSPLKKYNIPIKTINDGKAAAIAEKEYGAMRRATDCVFLCLGTGIGSAVFLNNQLLKANRNQGFELGHMVIDKEGIQCNCGKKGCFERYCSMKVFKSEISKVLSELYPRKEIADGETIKTLLQENIDNSKIQEIIDTYIENLVIGLSNIIDIFEPELICLGGSFVHFKDILYNKLVNKMEEKRYVFNKDSLPQIVLGKFKNDAGIIGAALA